MAEAGTARRLMLATLMALLLVVLFVAARQGIAAVAEYLLEAHLDSWAAAKNLPDEAEWQKSRGFLDLSLQMTPDNPRALQLGGRLYEWRAVIDKAQGRVDSPAMAQSLALYRQAVARRPTWPYAWMQLMQAKARSGEFDAEFQQAYAMAHRYGPWEKDLHQGLSESGLRAYRELSADNRRILEESLRRLAGDKPKVLIALAERFRKVYLVCYGVRGVEQITDYCRREGIRR